MATKNSFLSIQQDKSFMKECKALIKAIPECSKKAEWDALKKGVTALTDSKGGMPSVYNVKKSDMTKYIKTQQDSIKVRSNLFTSVHFGFTPKTYTSQAGIPIKRRKKSTMTVMKGQKKSHPEAFIINPARVNGGNVMLWSHNGKGPRWYEPLRRVSAAQMAMHETVQKHVEEEMTKRYNERLEHYYDRVSVGGKK